MNPGPLRGFTWEAAGLLSLAQSCLLFGTIWGNPSGGIRVVDSSPLFLGHVLGTDPERVMLRHFSAWVMDMFNADSVGGRQPIV